MREDRRGRAPLSRAGGALRRLLIPFFSLALLLPASVTLGADEGAEGAEAPARVIPLWPAGTPGIDPTIPVEQLNEGRMRGIRNPWITVHPAPAESATGAAVVICPGGGYGIVAAGHEGDLVAEWLNGLGIHAFVLRYRLPSSKDADYRHPAPLQDAQRAIAIVRSRAAEFGVDPGRIGIMGFSAGGHLASTATTHFDEPVIGPTESLGVSVRPDFAILVYPVVSFADDDIAHKGSRNNLLGDKDGPELRRRLSAELQVTPRTPPVFLVHAKDDAGVKPENSIRLHEALKAAGIETELHLYEDGGHGAGLGKPGTDFSRWPADCAAWLRSRGLARN